MGSAPSLLSMVSVTSARPSADRAAVPAKTTSSILPPRSGLTPCWPMTQENASTTLDLPDPFGPTTQVMPGSKRSVVADANDLNPRNVRVFRYTACAPHQPVLVDSLRRAPPNPTVRHAGYELFGRPLGSISISTTVSARRPAGMRAHPAYGTAATAAVSG